MRSVSAVLIVKLQSAILEEGIMARYCGFILRDVRMGRTGLSGDAVKSVMLFLTPVV